MKSNRRRDTSTELAIRSALHAAGLRYRVDAPIRIDGARPIRPDVVFPRQRVAVFIDGCFWHGCPKHGTMPATNSAYWSPKIAENQKRDARNVAVLESAGWIVLRVWEHEAPAAVANRVAHVVRSNASNSLR
jgi:DNA mismatch endonuclease, patch repair protein